MSTQPATPFNVLLIGDDCTDVYQYGIVDRISPEAPVPIFVPHHKIEKPGMAGNVFENLRALGCKVNYLHGHTSVKTRLIDSRSKQQIVRIDHDADSVPLEILSEIPKTYDAVGISDYNKGTVSYELIEELISLYPNRVFIDTKKNDLMRFENAWVKINKLEYSKIKTECTGLIVTQGEQGAVWNGHTFSAKTVEVVDVTGAGDTFLSALCYQFLNTNDMHQAINFAMNASAITVQHVGCYAPTLKEIYET